jgi:prepilin signal peptidase PulO-like enzyme (type II secretory pathway)
MTVWATVRSRAGGSVSPPLDLGVPWVGRTLKVGLTRSAYGFLLVLAIALLLRVLLPAYTALPSTWVVVLVALFAGGIAYLMSYTAGLKTARQAGDRAAPA